MEGKGHRGHVLFRTKINCLRTAALLRVHVRGNDVCKQPEIRGKINLRYHAREAEVKSVKKNKNNSVAFISKTCGSGG